ncbi:MAG: hypothetical protein ACYTGL_11170 [Planctomycetota bacterium]|jgi:hypothetical protein
MQRFLSRPPFTQFCCACLVAVLAMLPTIAAVADTEPSAASVAALLKQLDSKSRQDRLSAETELLKLGPGILDYLPPPDLLPNVAVRQAVSRVRTQLERVAAQQSIAASRVTLRNRLSIRQIVAEIAEQTGNAVECQLPKGATPRTDAFQRTLSVDWKDVTFWNAIRQLEAAGLRATYADDDSTLKLIPVRETSPAATTQTEVATRPQVAIQTQKAFRIDALPPMVRAIDGSEAVLVRVPLRVFSEPRLRPLFLRCAMSDLELTAGGTKLAALSPESRIEIPLGDGGREAAFELSFIASRSLAAGVGLKLSGQLSLLAAALERPITFKRLSEARGLTRRRGGVSVTVTETSLSPRDADSHRARVSVSIGYDSGANAFESHQTWVFHNRVILRDRDGREFGPEGGFSTLFQGDGTVGVEYRFRDLPKHPAEWQFTYVAPTLLINVPLDVRLDGIRVAAE